MISWFPPGGNFLGPRYDVFWPEKERRTPFSECFALFQTLQQSIDVGGTVPVLSPTRLRHDPAALLEFPQGTLDGDPEKSKVFCDGSHRESAAALGVRPVLEIHINYFFRQIQPYLTVRNREKNNQNRQISRRKPYSIWNNSSRAADQSIISREINNSTSTAAKENPPLRINGAKDFPSESIGNFTANTKEI